MRSAIFTTLLLVTMASWAQQPQPPAPPETPPAPPVMDKETRKEIEKAKRDAAKARAEARRMVREMHGSYLGVDIRDVTSERAGALKLKQERGVEITMVDQDAPAGKAGLQEHDVILSFNGANVESVDQLRRMMGDTPPGRKVSLGISREGKPLTVNVQLADRMHYAMVRPGKPMFTNDLPRVMALPPDFEMPQISVLQFSSRNGMLVEDLTPQLREFFGVKSGEGVLVRSVEKGSAAEAAGLRAGDVIVKVGNDHIGCTSDWRQLMRQQRGGTVPLGIIRDKREQSVSLKLPEQKTSDMSTYNWEWPDVQFDLEELNQEINRDLQRITPEVQRAVQASLRLSTREVQRALKEAQRQIEQEMRKAHEED